MTKHWKPFVIGATTMLVLFAGFYMFFMASQDKLIHQQPSPTSNAAVQPDAVTITPLPTLRLIRGNEVPFEGKVELKQAIAGRFAQNVTVVSFQATGEHADKSVLKIIWENGEEDKLSPGTQNKTFSPDKRAVEISVSGYSVHERRLFKDSNRSGTLTWEIRYEPVEQ